MEPPKWHDVGGFLLQFADRFEAYEREKLEQLAEISARLRKEREFSFYGDIDFIPTEQYSLGDAQRAINEAQMTVEAAAQTIPAPEKP